MRASIACYVVHRQKQIIYKAFGGSMGCPWNSKQASLTSVCALERRRVAWLARKCKSSRLWGCLPVVCGRLWCCMSVTRSTARPSEQRTGGRVHPLTRKWLQIVEKHIPDGTNVVLHTDGAHAYGPAGATDGLHHTRVIHSGPTPAFACRTTVNNVVVVAVTQA
eukprot:5719613-Amphidinium_carterae.1